jgi:hypothetical protein
MNIKKLLFVLFTIFTLSIFSKDISNQNGDWEVGSTWSKSVVPTTEDTLIIQSGDTVEITSNYVYPSDVVVIVRGALKFSGKLNLTSDSKLYVDGGALITTGGGNSDKLKIGGVGYWDGNDGDLTVDTGFPLGPPLPVELLYFKSHIFDNKVNLQWATASELNNDYFIVQKSGNINDWVDVSTIDGNGNSSSIITYYSFDCPDYSYQYYRLKQVDYNGDFDYSKIIHVNINIDRNKERKIKYYVGLHGNIFYEQPEGLSIIMYDSGHREKVFKL